MMPTDPVEIGMRVCKTFDGYDQEFYGTIVKQYAKEQMYHVIYDDGDSEDLTLEQLSPLLLKIQPSQVYSQNMALVGCRFVRTTEQNEIQEGIVQYYNSTNGLYHVLYNNGKEENILEDEILDGMNNISSFASSSSKKDFIIKSPNNELKKIACLGESKIFEQILKSQSKFNPKGALWSYETHHEAYCTLVHVLYDVYLRLVSLSMFSKRQEEKYILLFGYTKTSQNLKTLKENKTHDQVKIDKKSIHKDYCSDEEDDEYMKECVVREKALENPKHFLSLFIQSNGLSMMRIALKGCIQTIQIMSDDEKEKEMKEEEEENQKRIEEKEKGLTLIPPKPPISSINEVKETSNTLKEEIHVDYNQMVFILKILTVLPYIDGKALACSRLGNCLFKILQLSTKTNVISINSQSFHAQQAFDLTKWILDNWIERSLTPQKFFYPSPPSKLKQHQHHHKHTKAEKELLTRYGNIQSDYHDDIFRSIFKPLSISMKKKDLKNSNFRRPFLEEAMKNSNMQANVIVSSISNSSVILRTPCFVLDLIYRQQIGGKEQNVNEKQNDKLKFSLPVGLNLPLSDQIISIDGKILYSTRDEPFHKEEETLSDLDSIKSMDKKVYFYKAYVHWFDPFLAIEELPTPAKLAKEEEAKREEIERQLKFIEEQNQRTYVRKQNQISQVVEETKPLKAQRSISSLNVKRKLKRKQEHLDSSKTSTAQSTVVVVDLSQENKTIYQIERTLPLNRSKKSKKAHVRSNESFQKKSLNHLAHTRSISKIQAQPKTKTKTKIKSTTTTQTKVKINTKTKTKTNMNSINSSINSATSSSNQRRSKRERNPVKCFYP